MLFSSCTLLSWIRRYLSISHTWKTLLNYVFEDLRRTKAPNRVQIDVEVVGDLPLELANGFILVLRDVFMFPIYRGIWLVYHVWTMMVLIVILEMGNVRYFSIYESVGLAFQKEDLYLLSLRENVNSVSDINEKVSSSMNENRKQKRT
jgi:hypothetical protein